MERIYTHLSPGHLERQFGKRASLTALDGNGKDAASKDAVDVSSLDDRELAELARKAADELARRRGDE